MRLVNAFGLLIWENGDQPVIERCPHARIAGKPNSGLCLKQSGHEGAHEWPEAQK